MSSTSELAILGFALYWNPLLVATRTTLISISPSSDTPSREISNIFLSNGTPHSMILFCTPTWQSNSRCHNWINSGSVYVPLHLEQKGSFQTRNRNDSSFYRQSCLRQFRRLYQGTSRTNHLRSQACFLIESLFPFRPTCLHIRMVNEEGGCKSRLLFRLIVFAPILKRILIDF